jgi:hypothetical protein
MPYAFDNPALAAAMWKLGITQLLWDFLACPYEDSARETIYVTSSLSV